MFIVKLGVILFLMTLGVCIGALALYVGAKLAYMQFGFDSLIPAIKYLEEVIKITGKVVLTIFLGLLVIHILFVVLITFWVLFGELFKLLFWFMF